MTTTQKSLNVDARFVLPDNDCEQQATPDVEIIEFDYSKRSQWLRAAVLGATDGLVSIGSLMMGVGAVKQDVKAMILTGCAGLVAGGCSMAIGEFVSVQSQLDIEHLQLQLLPLAIGAAVPLLAASFIGEYKLRLGVVVGAVTMALVLFGWLGAVLGKAPIIKSSLTILIGGWFAMAITFGLTKLIGASGL
ncbi:hypothetical protein OIU76_026922 [Salix suchowensis]|nr:hypothetical protein OIU76_026922 [Salix suchowensis]